jgi:hypothetical protein
MMMLRMRSKSKTKTRIMRSCDHHTDDDGGEGILMILGTGGAVRQ